MNYKFLATGLLVVSLAGCAVAPTPPLSFTLSNVGISSVRKNAELRSLTVTIASASEATGKLYPAMIRTPGLWKTALEEALNNMVIFTDDAKQKVNLSVKIVEYDPPMDGGIDMVTKAAARYEILDRANGDIIFSQTFSTTGTVAMSENLNGNARIIESANMAVRENIRQFLLALEDVDMTKPMFPAKQKAK